MVKIILRLVERIYSLENSPFTSVSRQLGKGVDVMSSLNTLFFTAALMVIVTSEMLPTSVVIVYRHGDRTPVDPYPLDPWRDPSYWPVPFGELTNRGKLQHYELGQVLRNKYQVNLARFHSFHAFILHRYFDIFYFFFIFCFRLTGSGLPTGLFHVKSFLLSYQSISLTINKMDQSATTSYISAFEVKCSRLFSFAVAVWMFGCSVDKSGQINFFFKYLTSSDQSIVRTSFKNIILKIRQGINLSDYIHI